MQQLAARALPDVDIVLHVYNYTIDTQRSHPDHKPIDTYHQCSLVAFLHNHNQAIHIVLGPYYIHAANSKNWATFSYTCEDNYSDIKLSQLAHAVIKMPTEQEFLGNKEWVKKIKEHFTYLDTNKNGFLSVEDWILMVDNLKAILGVAEEKVTTVREVHIKLAARLGAKSGVQLTEEEFVKSAARFAENEDESRACLKEVTDALFDVLDTNRDGTLSLVEYTKLLQSCNIEDPEIAKAVFDSVDANHDGKIQIEELYEVSDKFWFTLDPLI